MNETEIERIAAAVNVLRPDWPIASLRTLLGRPELVRRPRRDVAVALTWVACESATKTPARVLEAGPWWVATGAESGEDRRWAPPKAEEACGKHPGEHRDRCRICAVDSIPAYHDETEPVTPVRGVVTEHLRSLRGLKAGASANHCACGVPRDHCADHRDEETTDA